MTGKLIGIARRSARRAPMEELTRGSISLTAGLQGDFKGAKHKTRQITVLAKEDWIAALKTLEPCVADLPWTTRRANLLVEGMRLPRVAGAVLTISSVQLEVTGQTYPCKRMEEASPGLLKALAPDWRGGVTCKVTQAGDIKLGDAAYVLTSPPEPPPRKLP